MLGSFRFFLRKYIYQIIIYLFLILSLNSFEISNMDIIIYSIFHILFVLYSFYDEFKLNYFTTFLLGFFLDIFLIDEFGPHLLTFMFFLFIIKKIKFLFINRNFLFLISMNIFCVIILLLTEKLFLFIVYGYNFSILKLAKTILFSVILSYPIYILLNYIKRKI